MKYKKYKFIQPTYKELWDAFVQGAREARMNPKATEKDFNIGADAYCKLIHQRLDPELFEALNKGNFYQEGEN